MDGHPNKKTKTWKGNAYSETRYAVIKWLEKELPALKGSVINIGAGNWDVPKTLLTPSNITEYKTLDQKYYGDGKNKVDIRGDILAMPAEWTNKWNAVLCIEVLECIPDPFKAVEEMRRILVPGGLMLLTAPFSYRFFGQNTGLTKTKNRVYDYWRFTRDGHELLCKNFSKVVIDEFGGTGPHDRFSYCVKAVK